MIPYQQSFKINDETQSINVNYIGSNGQFLFLEISLVYDKSHPRNTIYDSYDAEIAATKIQSLKVENASDTSSLTSKIKYDVNNDDNKYWLYVKLAAFNCGGSTIAPLTYYANNKIYQELVREENYLVISYEKLY